MKIANFCRQSTGKTTTFSADFIFTKPFILFNSPYPERDVLKKSFRLISHPREILNYIFPHKHTIWFTLPSEVAPPSHSIDAFTLIAMVFAYRLGENLYVDGEVSREIISKASAIEKYFRFEHPKRKSKINAKSIINRLERLQTISDSAQFFSLGLDSFYSLFCNDNHLQSTKHHLIFVDGFDIPLHHLAFLKTVHHNVDTVAKQIGGKAIYVKSNIRDVSDQIINWPQFHPVAMAAVGFLLPFRQLLMNGESYDWPDWGLRFGVDKLFSTTNLHFKLVGHNLTRYFKIKRLLKTPFFELFIKYLRVCWVNINTSRPTYNCSSCQKCIRTNLSFYLLNIKAPTFKTLRCRDIRALTLIGHIRHEWTELYEQLLIKPQVDQKIISAVEFLLRKPIRF